MTTTTTTTTTVDDVRMASAVVDGIAALRGVVKQAQSLDSAAAKSAFDYRLSIGRAIGEALYRAAAATLREQGNSVPDPRDFTWSKVADTLGIAKGTTFEGRAYSTLAEDHALYVYTREDAHLSAWQRYCADQGKPTTSVRDYLTFARRATTGGWGNAAKGKVARDREAAKAAAERDAKDEAARRAKQAERETNAATVVSHVQAHPSANLTTSLPVTCQHVAAMTVEQIDEAIAALQAWREQAKAAADAAKQAAKQAEQAEQAEQDDDPTPDLSKLTKAQLLELLNKQGADA